ncbi:hypothetical protein T07_8951 [Trichinella nelsoni]|uniref:Uncharacterized protein n=1 Tax=Trichinella nelsoni TaxID=6336 RepID=A0A0V0RAN5_9BILA|nr:hypothetical protein T07_8951 [Trichinella nelsoni]
MFTSFRSKLDRTVFDAVTFPSCSSVVSLIIKDRRNGL